jgi:thiamine monophosphate synthase
LIINEYVHVAKEADADGVPWPTDGSVESKIIAGKT